MNENPCFENNRQEENLQAEVPACESTDTSAAPVNGDSDNVECNETVPEILPVEAAEPPAEQPAEEEKKEQPAKGMAITSMILAIASHVLGMGLPLSVVALILGCVAKKRGNTSGFATAGVIIGIISTALWTLIILAFVLIILVAYLATYLNV